jgi:hypothetical protein
VEQPHSHKKGAAMRDALLPNHICGKRAETGFSIVGTATAYQIYIMKMMKTVPSTRYLPIET